MRQTLADAAMLDILAVRDEHVGDQARGEEPVIDDAGRPVEARRQREVPR